MLRTTYLGLGSNLGDRTAHLERALLQLSTSSVRVRRVSSLYDSAPQGPVTEQPRFYNVVAEVQTSLAPRALLAHCLHVESTLGRERRLPKGPRTIDLDLLLFEQEVLEEPELVLPHPELARRAFALVPLLELCPMAVHPQDGSLLCRHAGELIRTQPIVRLGSLPAFPATVRLPAPTMSLPGEGTALSC